MEEVNMFNCPKCGRRYNVDSILVNDTIEFRDETYEYGVVECECGAKLHIEQTYSLVRTKIDVQVEEDGEDE